MSKYDGWHSERGCTVGEVMGENAKLRDENAKLRELVRRMGRAMRIDSEWCNRDCAAEFECDCGKDGCIVEGIMRELGVTP